jgi:hypothetical protein
MNSSGQIEVHISLDKEAGTLNMEIAVPISLFTDPGNPPPASQQSSNGAFMTDSQITLRKSASPNHHVGELQIDEIRIPLRPFEFAVVKIFIETMIKDGLSSEKSNSFMGWVSSDELRGLSERTAPSSKQDPATYISSTDLAKCIHHLRNKLSNNAIPRSLIESQGKSYRISAPPSCLHLDL